MNCPDENTWFDVAGGMLSPAESLAYLQHAATCDACAQKLRTATRIFEDELSPAEEATLNSLPSSNPGGQRGLAEKLGRDAKLQNRYSEVKGLQANWKKLLFYLTPLTAALVIFFLVVRDPAGRVEGLLADAYTKNRSIEMRFAGADHADIQQHRGGNERSLVNKPDAYLKAAAEIKSQLTKNPDNPKWLLLQAQLDLLDTNPNYKSAILSLDSIHEADSTALQLTRSVALYERARHENQQEFYGAAEELLGKILQKEPDNTTALFNQAVVCAKLNFCECAIKSFHRFLELEKDEGWKREAQQRLDPIIEKKTLAPDSCVNSTTRP